MIKKANPLRIFRENKEFFKTIIQSFFPPALSKLTKRSNKEAFGYFFSLFSLMFIIMFMTAAPLIVNLPDYFKEKLDAFDSLQIRMEQEQNKPIFIPDHNTIIKIDLRESNQTIGSEKMLIQKGKITYKWFFFKREIETEKISDLVTEKEEFSQLVTLIILLMIPGIILITYSIFLVKYLLLVFLAVAAGFALIRVSGHELKTKKILGVALYSTTIMIIPETILLPFNINTYHLPLLLYAVYFLVGIFSSAEKKMNLTKVK